jgi:hypothetical protein
MQIKIIAGIQNFDLENVLNVARAAAQGGTMVSVDIAADPALVIAVKAECPDLHIFVSSVTPVKLAEAIAAGAHVAELGNFDALYAEGFYITAEQVLQLAQETLALLPSKTPLCVTIPGHLSLQAQQKLALALQALGVSIIQTEGASRVVSLNKTVLIEDAAEKLALTLENTRHLAQVLSIPIMTASGISSHNAAQAMQAGASLVGIGQAVNRLNSLAEMKAEVLAVIKALTEHPQIAVVA